MDVNLQHRRRIAAEALDILAASESAAAGSLTPFDAFRSDFFRLAADWLHGFLTALGRLSTDASSAEAELIAAVRQLVDLRATVMTVEPKRPFLALQNCTRNIIHESEALTRAYLQAIAVDTPLAAQRHGDAAQRHLDAAAAIADQLSDHIHIMELYCDATSPTELIPTLTAAAMSAAGAENILQLAKIGSAQLATLLQTGVTPDLGVDFLVSRTVATTWLDPSRFDSVLQQAYQVLNANLPRLKTLAASPSYLDDLYAAALDTFDSGWSARHVLTTTTVVRQACRALLDLAATLVERPGQLVVSTLLIAAGHSRHSYERLRRDDAVGLLNRANQQQRLRPLLEGIDPDLRKAEAHGAVQYTEDGLITDLRSGQRHFSLVDLCNNVFEGMESVLACLLALRCALAAAGISTERATIFGDLGLSVEEKIAAILLSAGARRVNIDPQSSDRWAMELDCPESLHCSVAIAMVTPYLPDDLQALDISFSQGGVTRFITGPTAAYRSWAETDEGFLKQVRFVQLQTAWTVDGRPWMSPEFVRKWSALVASNTSDMDHPAAMGKLRSLRRMAQDIGDDELVNALKGLMAYRRLAAMGADASATQPSLLQLQAWATTPLASEPV